MTSKTACGEKKQCIDPDVVAVSLDENDTDFMATELATEPEDSEGSISSGWPNEFEEVFPSNTEVCSHLLYFISILTPCIGCRYAPSQDNSCGGAEAHAYPCLQGITSRKRHRHFDLKFGATLYTR